MTLASLIVVKLIKIITEDADESGYILFLKFRCV